MPKSVNETTLTIHGSTIQLRTDMSNEDLSRLAVYVDKKIREIDPKGKLPQNKVAILASISIAGELLEERHKSRRSREDLARRLEHLHEMLDEALGGG
jgi:cell division protein ZapA (FtsZ GTPase activity inhibitor)